MLAAIDCADQANQEVCINFGITGFPTLKVRPPAPGSHLVSLCFPCEPVPLLLNRISSTVAPKRSLRGFAGWSRFTLPQNCGWAAARTAAG